MSACSKIGTVVLFVVNVFVFFIFLFFFVVGVALSLASEVVKTYVWDYLKQQLAEQGEQDQNEVDFSGLFDEDLDLYGKLQTVAIPMIVISLIVLVVSFLGCCGACCKNKCMLGIYATVMALLCLCVLAGSLVIYLTYDKVKVEIEDKAGDVVNKHYVNETHKDIISLLFTAMQTDLGCCGAAGGEDYKDSQVMEKRYVGQRIPISCCHDWMNKNDLELRACTTLNAENEEYTSYNLGCVTKLFNDGKQYAHYVLIGIAAAGLCLAVLSIIGWLLFVYVLRRDRASDPEKK